ncbi:2-hydroxychromene-2-carboxylate isomerase [Salinactinospora qingdaonensis]|uniref:2-hydroxychromene-2-carboxylate isomerase n=1 Tax=Salinactinospora qingdaonensis TaxID=702744 RepID=A0ABP7F9U9_9ACTN
MRRPPRIHFSFRSPFSWMTVELLRRRVPDAMEAIRFIPFWDPDERTSRGLEERGGQFHYTQMSKAKHLYILQDTKRLAQRHGFPMVWPVDIDPWWELPHLAWLRAQRCGLAEPFYDALIRARWHRGEDICQTEAIRAAAKEAGADPDLLAGAVDDDEIRAEAVDCLFEAWRDDIFGIPYMRVGRHRFWGLDRLDDFLDAYLPLRDESEVPR